jgi:hypothetical protein
MCQVHGASHEVLGTKYEVRGTRYVLRGTIRGTLVGSVQRSPAKIELTRIPSDESIWGSRSKKDRLLKNQ